MSLLMPGRFFNGGDTMSPEPRRPALDPDPAPATPAPTKRRIFKPPVPIEPTAPRKQRPRLEPPPFEVPGGGTPPGREFGDVSDVPIFIVPEFQPESLPATPKEAPSLPEPGPDEKTMSDVQINLGEFVPPGARGSFMPAPGGGSGFIKGGEIVNGAVPSGAVEIRAPGEGLKFVPLLVGAAVVAGIIILVSMARKAR